MLIGWGSIFTTAEMSVFNWNGFKNFSILLTKLTYICTCQGRVSFLSGIDMEGMTVNEWHCRNFILFSLLDKTVEEKSLGKDWTSALLTAQPLKTELQAFLCFNKSTRIKILFLVFDRIENRLIESDTIGLVQG